MKTTEKEAKKYFLMKGTCSQTYFFLLNKEFGNQKESYERASDPLAGGIAQTGNQCGMLWGTALAIGSEAYRRYQNPDEAMARAIEATKNVMASFANRTKSINCREITGCDMTKNLDMARFVFKSLGHILVEKLGRTVSGSCYDIAGKWSEEAFEAAKKSFDQNHSDIPDQAMNCTSELIKKMGGSNQEAIMVAGFAGGMGLSGNGCGALSAAIWMKMLKWGKEHPGKKPSLFKNKDIQGILKKFYAETDSEIRCSKICERKFTSVDEHADFVKNGGCAKLIDELAQS